MDHCTGPYKCVLYFAKERYEHYYRIGKNAWSYDSSFSEFYRTNEDDQSSTTDRGCEQILRDLKSRIATEEIYAPILECKNNLLNFFLISPFQDGKKHFRIRIKKKKNNPRYEKIFPYDSVLFEFDHLYVYVDGRIYKKAKIILSKVLDKPQAIALRALYQKINRAILEIEQLVVFHREKLTFVTFFADCDPGFEKFFRIQEIKAEIKANSFNPLLWQDLWKKLERMSKHPQDYLFLRHVPRRTSNYKKGTHRISFWEKNSVRDLFNYTKSLAKRND